MLHAPRRTRSNAWEEVVDLAAGYGVALDDWQETVLQAALGERTDGRWSTPQVAVSAPRQQGKSELIVARALAGVLLFGEQQVLISAHQQDTAREVFYRLAQVIEDNDFIRTRVEEVHKSFNRERIVFKSGAVIRFKARSAGAGRGFTADCILLDEAQILSQAAWSAILPTTSARPNAQVWLLGTPPTAGDDGEVFGRLRAAGVEGREHRIAYLEWSAEPDDDFDDPATWARANPAYGTRISHDAIAAERAVMSDDQFAMERLGMWEEAASRFVIDPRSWDAIEDQASLPAAMFSLGIDVSPDRSTASVALAGQRADGLWHVELDENRKGVGWLTGYIKARCEANDIRAVVIDGASPAASIIDELTRMRIRVTTTQAREYAGACGSFYDGVHEEWLRHNGQPQLAAALGSARKRALGDAWAWNRKASNADITPLVAATLALHGAQTSKAVRPVRGSGSRGSRPHATRPRASRQAGAAL